MRKLLLLFVTIVLTACKNDNNCIIATNFNLLIPDSIQISTGITEKEQHIRTLDFFNTLKENTLNHEIPDMSVVDLNGNLRNLKEQLADTRLIISTSLTCAWNLEGLLIDFPNANKQVKYPFKENEVVLLIIRENNEYYNQQFEENIKEIKSKYSNVFIIDSLQSMRLNIFGLSRYYISKKQTVIDIGIGTSNIDILKNELEKNSVLRMGV